jgi:phospholipid/cholesterol/gamma-HCH transport system ATP-binding protein
MFELRKNMGVAFQGGALLSSLTVGENVQLPLVEHTRLDKKTMKIMARMKLEVVNLGGFDHLMPAQLSGGMIKRAAVARAIVMDPQLMFFDEPSAGLDPVVSAELDELILRLRDAMHMTIVVVTHELHSAYKIADRITVLDKGHILMTGTVDEVRASGNERIQSLLNRTPGTAELSADEYLNRLSGV